VRRLAMPVIEGALDRSVELAAAMDSRGYGRTTDSARVSRRATGVLVFAGLLGVCVGVYGLLDGTASGWLGLPMLVAGSALAAVGIWVGGRRTGRTKYRPDPWALPEWLVVACGAVAATAMFVNVAADPAQLYLASATAVPPVPLLACVGILVGLLPAFLAPPLPVPLAVPAGTGEPVLEVAA
jgi:energy-coupling factor transport system permease protein